MPRPEPDDYEPILGRREVARIHVPDRNVIEQRAPTDASVKLLREMEEAAKHAVIQSISVGNTAFECVVQAERVNWDDKLVLRAVFKLNGKQMTVDHEVPGYSIRLKGKTKADIVQDLMEKMGKVIAGEVLTGAFADLHNILRWPE